MLRSTLLLLAAPMPLFSADRFEFKDGDKVVLIGSTLIEREQRYGYWEAALTARNPDKNITFRNLGWSGDTVWGEARAGFGTIAEGYKQLVDHVIAEKPTVIIVGYGTNESFAGPAGLPKFKTQLKKLLDDLSVTKARFVLLSPMKMQKMPPPLPDPAKANENIETYAEAIEEEAQRRHARFIDQQIPFSGLITEKEVGLSAMTDNGLHLTDVGYEITANTVSTIAFGGLDPIYRLVIDPQAHAYWINDGPEVRLGGERILIRIKGEALSFGPVVVLKGPAKNKFRLAIDGHFVELVHAKVGNRDLVTAHGAEVEQYNALREAIIAKNKLYFYRWRPQNVTYLFGFRKHEQGNNAIEIPKFDPLIAEKEKEIAKLRVPREHVYELVPVKEKK